MRTRSPKIHQRTTLSEIARSSGVSVSTVSVVLAGKAKERRISQEVISRVQETATKLDYAPNLIVQSMQEGQTHVLSFFNGFRNRNQSDLYMDRLTTALEQAAGRLGYDVLIYCDFRRSEQETYRCLNGGRSDGVIFFAPQANDPLLPFLRTSRLPVVLVNRDDPEQVLLCVQPDMKDGMRQVGEQLVAFGHRRIAAITNNSTGNYIANQRIALLQEFLAGVGCAIPERWIVPTRDDNAAEAGVALRFLMREPEPPTALFCWHDRVGYQILEQCDALAIRVPEDLTIVGYDGLHWPAATRHLLASVSLDLNQLADAAIDLLVRLIQGQDCTSIQQVLPVRLTPGTTLSRA